jgi:branched-chain amino acid transport system substrate-binding protein
MVRTIKNARFRANILLFALSFVLIGCSGGSVSQPIQSSNTGKTILLGTDLPVISSPDGKAIQHAVDVAINANRNLGNGYTLDVVRKDDSLPDGSTFSTDIGKQNIQAMIDNPQIVAVVGPYNSGVAKVNLPLLQAAGIPTLSPAATAPWLTKREFAVAAKVDFDTMHPASKPNSFFRIIMTNDLQGRGIAYLATLPTIFGGYSARTAYIIDDGTDYGTDIATDFTTAFTQMGGTIKARHTATTPVSTDMVNSLTAEIVAMHPDIVMVGGTDAKFGGNLKHALYIAGLTQLPIYVGNGDALKPDWISRATNVAAVGTFATLPAPDESVMTSSADMDFITAYHAAFPGENISPYAFLGYDCAMLEIAAIKQLIQSGKAVTRSNVRDTMAHIQYKGITGMVAFDANGDNISPKAISVYGITDTSGTWRFQCQLAEADIQQAP